MNNSNITTDIVPGFWLNFKCSSSFSLCFRVFNFIYWIVTKNTETDKLYKLISYNGNLAREYFDVQFCFAFQNRFLG